MTIKAHPNKNTKTASDTSNHDLLTAREVASILRVDETTVRRWIKDGALEAVLLPAAHPEQYQQYRVKRTTLLGILNPPQMVARQ